MRRSFSWRSKHLRIVYDWPKAGLLLLQPLFVPTAFGIFNCSDFDSYFWTQRRHHLHFTPSIGTGGAWWTLKYASRYRWSTCVYLLFSKLALHDFSAWSSPFCCSHLSASSLWMRACSNGVHHFSMSRPMSTSCLHLLPYNCNALPHT